MTTCLSNQRINTRLIDRKFDFIKEKNKIKNNKIMLKRADLTVQMKLASKYKLNINKLKIRCEIK